MAAALADGEAVGGELDERGSRGRRRIELAEQAVLLFGRAGREVERVHIATCAAIAEGERPQLVNLDVLLGFILKSAEESTVDGVEGIDTGASFAEVAY